MEDNDKMSVSNSEHIETGNSIGTCPMNECFEYRKMVFKECALAGVSFHLKKDDEIWYELELGAELALVRDRKNKYDLNAVAVCLADDYDGNPDDFDFNFILGYVPRTDNAELAALLDAGYGDKLSAEITTLCNYGNINDRIRITIYIETSQPVFVRPDLLRAHSLNSHELNVLIVTIANYGTYYYRVGGFPTDERTLPTVGEKIVMVYEQPHDFVLTQMRVIAEGEDCRRFTDDEIDCVDDCSPYILTNILGPISVAKSDCEFLRGVDVGDFSGAYYLPKNLSDEFESIFKRYLNDSIYKVNTDSAATTD